MKIKSFAVRNIKEILRDPLSYIFCLGFPVIMLIVMSVINQSIPDTPGTPKIFNIEQLTPAIAFFGFTFVMLFTAIQISKDRGGAFLVRLYMSPMKSIDYILGYTIPVFIIGIAQIVITFIFGEIIAFITGTSIDAAKLLFAILVLIPSLLLFIGLGIIIGTLFNDKSAPGISSIFITVVSLIGGIWMDIDTMGGTIKSISEILPFYHGVKSARCTVMGNNDEILSSFLICTAFAVAIYIIAVVIFAGKMKSDKK